MKEGREEGRTPPDRCVERGLRGLTERGLRGGGPLHARAVVGHVVVGTGAHRPAGTEQAQPLALLPVTWVGGHWRGRRGGERRRNVHQEKHFSFSAAFSFKLQCVKLLKKPVWQRVSY